MKYYKVVKQGFDIKAILTKYTSILPIPDQSELLNKVRSDGFLQEYFFETHESSFDSGFFLKQSVIGFINNSVSELAEFYAHHTNQEPIFVDRTLLISNNKIKSLVLLSEDIDMSLFSMIDEFKDIHGFVPSLIFSNTIESLFLVLLNQIYFYHLNYNETQNKRLLLLSHMFKGFDRLDFYNTRIIGNKLFDLTVFKEEISNQENLMIAINTHSDGFDAQLGPFVLCSIDENDIKRKNLALCPHCIKSSHCRRMNMSINDSIRSLNKIVCNDFKCKILFFGVCNGVRPNLQPYNNYFGLANKFLLNPNIGCIITTNKIEFISTEHVDFFVSRISEKKSVGETLKEYYESELFSISNTRFYLLGADNIRSNFMVDYMSISKKINISKRTDLSNKELLKLAFLECHLYYLMKNNIKIKNKSSNTLRLLNDIKYSKNLLERNIFFHKLGKKLLNIYQYLDSELFEDWFLLSKSFNLISKKHRCGSCGCESDLYKFNFGIKNQHRFSVNCTQCNFSYDSGCLNFINLSIEISTENKAILNLPYEFAKDSVGFLKIESKELKTSINIRVTKKEMNGKPIDLRKVQLPEIPPYYITFFFYNIRERMFTYIRRRQKKVYI
jgi:hypothetical protein